MPVAKTYEHCCRRKCLFAVRLWHPNRERRRLHKNVQTTLLDDSSDLRLVTLMLRSWMQLPPHLTAKGHNVQKGHWSDFQRGPCRRWRQPCFFIVLSGPNCGHFGLPLHASVLALHPHPMPCMERTSSQLCASATSHFRLVRLWHKLQVPAPG